MIAALLAVASGGFLGGLMRWLLSHTLPAYGATLTANALASFTLGLAFGAPSLWGLCGGTGFAGALSTWSTLAKQLGSLVLSRKLGHAILYVSATIIAGCFCAGAGLAAAGWIGWR